MRAANCQALFVSSTLLFASQALSQEACEANCTLTGLPRGEIFHWSALTINRTLTPFTVIQIINTDLDTTRTSTIIDEDVDLPTNADGTRTHVMTYIRDGVETTTDIAFPTNFQIYPQRWEWDGVLSTTNDLGVSVCRTTAGATFSYDYFQEPEEPTGVPAMPDDSIDPRGWYFSLQGGMFADAADPDPVGQDALKSCSRTANAPVQVAYAAAYVTATSVIYESWTSASETKTAESEQSTTDSELTASATSPTTRTVVSEGSSGLVTITETAGTPQSTKSWASSTSLSPASFWVLLLSVAFGVP